MFAPTNDAFNALPAGVLDNLLKPENKAQLVDILTYHVVAGNVQSASLTNGELVPTVEGKNVSVNIEAVGGVYLNIGACCAWSLPFALHWGGVAGAVRAPCDVSLLLLPCHPCRHPVRQRHPGRR